MSATRLATRPATERPVRSVTDCPNISRLCESNDKAQWVVIGAIFAGAISASLGCMALAGVNGLCQMGITGGVVLIAGGTLILILTTLFSMYRHAPTYLNDVPVTTHESRDALRSTLIDVIIHQLRAARDKFILNRKEFDLVMNMRGYSSNKEEVDTTKSKPRFSNMDSQQDPLNQLHGELTKYALIPYLKLFCRELECDYCVVTKNETGQMIAFQQHVRITVGKTEVSAPHFYSPFNLESQSQFVHTVNARAQIGPLIEP